MRKLGILICIIIISFAANIYAGQNLVNNPDLEIGNGALPDGWERWQYSSETTDTVINWETSNAQSGSRCISIENKQKNDARLIQEVQVQENKKYRLSAWIKTENVGSDITGANISVWYHPESSFDVKGTQAGWMPVEMYVRTMKGVSTFHITLALGGHGSMNLGKAWFDNISVEEVNEIPADAKVSTVKAPGDTSAVVPASQGNSSTPLILLLVILSVAVVAGVILLNIFGKKKKSKSK